MTLCGDGGYPSFKTRVTLINAAAAPKSRCEAHCVNMRALQAAGCKSATTNPISAEAPRTLWAWRIWRWPSWTSSSLSRVLPDTFPSFGAGELLPLLLGLLGHVALMSLLHLATAPSLAEHTGLSWHLAVNCLLNGLANIHTHQWVELPYQGQEPTAPLAR